jgi:membrane protein YdbS with pleckstrin-like domain
MSPTFDSQSARDWIVLIAVLVLGSAGVGNALYFRGKHPGWVLLAVTVGLALAGR